LNILAVCGSLRQKFTNMGRLHYALQQAAVKAPLQQFKQADALIFAYP